MAQWKRYSFDEYDELNEQHSVVEARRAHNPEVPGSKPGVAIFFVFLYFFFVYFFSFRFFFWTFFDHAVRLFFFFFLLLLLLPKKD